MPHVWQGMGGDSKKCKARARWHINLPGQPGLEHFDSGANTNSHGMARYVIRFPLEGVGVLRFCSWLRGEPLRRVAIKSRVLAH
jgi:hypothetical protein